MAYTILDNKTAVLNTRGPVSQSFQGSINAYSYRSGLASPNGQIIAVSTAYRNNSTTLNQGIDFRKSGSEGHMDLIDSIPTIDGSGNYVTDMVWINNKELVYSTTEQNESLVVVTASADGENFGIHKKITATYSSQVHLKLELSPDKTKILGYQEAGINGGRYIPL